MIAIKLADGTLYPISPELSAGGDSTGPGGGFPESSSSVPARSSLTLTPASPNAQHVEIAFFETSNPSRELERVKLEASGGDLLLELEEEAGGFKVRLQDLDSGQETQTLISHSLLGGGDLAGEEASQGLQEAGAELPEEFKDLELSSVDFGEIESFAEAGEEEHGPLEDEAIDDFSLDVSGPEEVLAPEEAGFLPDQDEEEPASEEFDSEAPDGEQTLKDEFLSQDNIFDIDDEFSSTPEVQDYQQEQAALTQGFDETEGEDGILDPEEPREAIDIERQPVKNPWLIAGILFLVLAACFGGAYGLFQLMKGPELPPIHSILQ